MRGYGYIIGATLIAVGLIGGIGLFVGGLMPVLQGPTSQFDANGSTVLSDSACSSPTDASGLAR